MSLYFELLQKPIFSVEDIAGRYEKISDARSAIKSLVCLQLSRYSFLAL